ncbi:MAG: GGDEF domain-containing protein, partial [Actinomycetota bacterium]|nr:GGDEF domain-containing protein [Actinomycetota bacterium]
GCTVFALLAGYGALFHSLRLLSVTWLVAAGTLAVLGWRLADADVALVAAAVAATTVLNLVVALASHLVIRLADIREYHEDIDPLTGLLTGEAFIAHAATLIGARNRGDDQHLVIVDVRIDELARRAEGAAGLNRVRIALAGQLRETLRHDAVIAHVGDREFLVADVFTVADPTPLLDRIRGTVAAPPARRTASIGVVSSPLSPLAQHPSPEVLEELLRLAKLAAAEVEAHGGNDIRVTANPALGVLGRDDASGEH